MAEGTVIKPDLDFVKKIMKSGGGDSLKKCYQCATCSVVCNVTPDDKPFPRKEMLQAQWGLKDKLFGNPDIWLCHHCSDCTAYCPRGAKPGEVLGAVRKMSIEHYAFPGFLGKMVGDPKYLLLALAAPVLLLLVVIGLLGNLRIPEGEIIYAEKFMPVIAIDTIYILAALFASVGFVVGIKRYWNDLKAGVEFSTNKWQKMVKGPLPIIIVNQIVEFMTHKRFKNCDVTGSRSFSHLLVFFGFVGLAITTTWAIVYLYAMHWESPYPLSDPMKILGNVSALILLVGILLVILNRLKNAGKAGLGSYYDWLFICIVLTIVTTGILSEVLRLKEIAHLAYPVYFIHLVSVLFLFAYAPFSKMAHMVYRMTALVFSKYSGREDKKF
ncbi:MAG: quinone-interacting membrane-bound oxidoreductase complex subunit QmoC [Nitrospiraceae bacterium]|nr:MAG: quinone-interacting membrane-bound oxidoreductase complex subunit QmoC [Nitrospiraceae bacterium]